MVRRSRSTTLPMAAVAGLCALAVGCADDVPSGPGAAPEPSALVRGHVNATTEDVIRAIGNNVHNLAPILDATDLGGAPPVAQVAALSRQVAGFPTEGSHYLVISSGDAAAPDVAARRNTRFGPDAGAPYRWDRGGVEIVLRMPPGARWLAMDVRYFSWDGLPHQDPVRVTATYEDTLADGVTTEARTIVLREYTTVSEIAGAAAYGTLSLGRLRNEEFDARKLRNKTVVVRIEAEDSGDGDNDSGLLVDNVRVVNGKFEDWDGPVVTGTTVNPGPVPTGTLFRIVSELVDRGPTVARIRAAEISVDDGPWTPMTVGGRTDSSATARYVFDAGVADAGVYTICVRGQDAKGNIGQPDCVDQAIYDPSEGTFLTGSGWVYANHGSDPLDWDVAGRATFSVSAGYRPRADPTKPPLLRGDASFFYLDDETGMTLRFFSTELSYVTVERSRVFANLAGEKPVGRIVGKGRLFRNDVLVRGTRSPLHSFLISAVDEDGKLRPAGDRLRIRVWDTASGNVVLDTQLGETNSQDAFALREAAVPFTWTQAGGVLLKHTVPAPSAP